VVRAETANADLQDDIGSLQDRLAAIVRDRADAEERLSQLASQADVLSFPLEATEVMRRALEETGAQLSQQHGEIQRQLAVSEEAASSKATRNARLTERSIRLSERCTSSSTARDPSSHASARSKPIVSKSGRHGQYKAGLEQTEKKLQQLGVERDKAASERDRLRAQIGELEQTLSQRESPRPEERVAEAKPVEAVPVQPAQSEANPPHAEVKTTDIPAKSKRGTVSELDGRGIGEFERVRASAGVDIARLLPQFGVTRAEGGTFEPPPRADQPADGLGADRLAAMRGSARSLPLSTPLEHYQLRSRFGPRCDPFNGKAAFHTGLDFNAPYMSPIYATAPRIVTFAGYRGNYGKVVEIDHGNGIATRSAYMHRYTVSVGQRVEAHTRIGFLGSTGRAFGPHVHYEVIVNGEPQDPEKFIGRARLVPIAEK